MRKILLTLTTVLILCVQLSAQTIVDVQPFGRKEGARFIVLLSDNSMWWYAEKLGWDKISTAGLPQNFKPKQITTYVNVASKLVCVLDDNSIWWFREGGVWEKAPQAGLPPNADIKFLRGYVTPDLNTSGRLLALLSDNSMWWYSEKKDWQAVTKNELPANAQINHISSYYDYDFMNVTTRYAITLADKSIWTKSETGKEWKRREGEDLPFKEIKCLESYLKMSAMSSPEGRLIVVLSDESIWYLGSKKKQWKTIEMNGLPKGYKIKSLRVYQKNTAIAGESRLILKLEDNSIWWWADGKDWQKLPTAGLPITQP